MVIEIDGNVHADIDVSINDKEREDAIKSLGISILRFTNEQVTGNLENVIAQIENYIKINKPL
ncbi:MAG: DUF559 domain-containing protein [Taibaiella sp.]|nr:DUF559 domain-containing protein [Taibaiella sp.]